jgi:hypothetical protein
MKISRTWGMPDKCTFRILPVKNLLKFYVGEGLNWIDPFAGDYSPAEITNDLNPNKKTKYHLNAMEFLRLFKAEEFSGGIYDPPYSVRQIKECYDSIGLATAREDTKCTFYSKSKDELARVIKPNGIAICCGWNSMGLGMSRGFEMIEILLVPHGGPHNDTIVTVERKIQDRLECD